MKRVKLVNLIEKGIIKTPFKIEASFKGSKFSATIDSDGFILLENKRYTSLSIAAGIIKAQVSGAPNDGLEYRQIGRASCRERVFRAV